VIKRNAQLLVAVMPIAKPLLHRTKIFGMGDDNTVEFV
jgi:hypothetical protein